MQAARRNDIHGSWQNIARVGCGSYCHQQVALNISEYVAIDIFAASAFFVMHGKGSVVTSPSILPGK